MRTWHPSDAKFSRPYRKLSQRFAFNAMSLPIAESHVAVMKRLGLPLEDYVTAYLVAHLLRGRNYALNLRGRGLLYTTHWTRRPLNFILGLDERFTGREPDGQDNDPSSRPATSEVSIQENPWGAILLLNIRNGLLKPTPTRLENALKTIRGEVLRDRSSENLLVSADPETVLKEQCKILLRAGVPPVPKNEKDYVDWLTLSGTSLSGGAKALGFMSGLASVVVAAVFVAIKLASSSQAVKNLDARMQLHISFERFRRVYRVPGVTDDASSERFTGS